VAAALRVNGDTVADDSLAELDELSGNDIIAALARIVTEDVALEAPNLQQAFAAANETIRQANALIGDYPTETFVLPPLERQAAAGLVNGRGHHHETVRSSPADSDLARPLPLFPTASDRDAAPANGHSRDLGAANPAYANGVTHGAAHGTEPKSSGVAGGNSVAGGSDLAGSNGTTNDQPDRPHNGQNRQPVANGAPAAGDAETDGLTPIAAPPPVPRPRLLF